MSTHALRSHEISGAAERDLDRLARRDRICQDAADRSAGVVREMARALYVISARLDHVEESEQLEEIVRELRAAGQDRAHPLHMYADTILDDVIGPSALGLLEP